MVYQIFGYLYIQFVAPFYTIMSYTTIIIIIIIIICTISLGILRSY